MILCCGEALIDMLPRQMNDGSEVFLPLAGGAICNTAIALGRLGEATGLLAGISTDIFGEQLIRELDASNVSTQYCVRLPNPSTLAFVKLSHGQAQYTFMDENSAVRSLSEAMLPTLPETISTLHFGAVSLISEPCGSTYETLMRTYHQSRVISLDPNIRPGFIYDPQSHRSRIKRMMALSDVVKISDEDLDWICEGKNRQDAVDEIIANGASVVLLTRGGDGASAYTGRYNLDCPARSIEVADTIGAGDAFNAGFLACLNSMDMLDKSALKNIKSEDLAEALDLASLVAATTATRAGANPPWKSELSL